MSFPPQHVCRVVIEFSLMCSFLLISPDILTDHLFLVDSSSMEPSSSWTCPGQSLCCQWWNTLRLPALRPTVCLLLPQLMVPSSDWSSQRKTSSWHNDLQSPQHNTNNTAMPEEPWLQLFILWTEGSFIERVYFLGAFRHILIFSLLLWLFNVSFICIWITKSCLIQPDQRRAEDQWLMWQVHFCYCWDDDVESSPMAVWLFHDIP